MSFQQTYCILFILIIFSSKLANSDDETTLTPPEEELITTVATGAVADEAATGTSAPAGTSAPEDASVPATDSSDVSAVTDAPAATDSSGTPGTATEEASATGTATTAPDNAAVPVDDTAVPAAAAAPASKPAKGGGEPTRPPNKPMLEKEPEEVDSAETAEDPTVQTNITLLEKSHCDSMYSNCMSRLASANRRLGPTKLKSNCLKDTQSFLVCEGFSEDDADNIKENAEETATPSS